MTYNKNLNGVGKDKWYKGLIQNSRYCYLRFIRDLLRKKVTIYFWLLTTHALVLRTDSISDVIECVTVYVGERIGGC